MPGTRSSLIVSERGLAFCLLALLNLLPLVVVLSVENWLCVVLLNGEQKAEEEERLENPKPGHVPGCPGCKK